MKYYSGDRSKKHERDEACGNYGGEALLAKRKRKRLVWRFR